MKTKKNRIVLSAVSVLLVFSLLVGGTMAWFTDTEKVNGNFTAGVLDIEVNPGEDGYTTTEPLEFENLRPMWYENFYKELEPKIAFGNELDNNVAANGMQDSDYRPVPVYFKPLQIENRGTLPTKVDVSVNLGDPCKDGEEKIELSEDKNTVNWAHEKNGNCTNGLQKVLKIFIYKQEAGSWKRIENVNLNKLYDDAVADPDGVAEHNTALETADIYTTAMIPAGEKATYVVAGYLPETVGNEYQGKHYHADVMFNAYQMDENAGGGNPDSGSSEKPDPETYDYTIHHYLLDTTTSLKADTTGKAAAGELTYTPGNIEKDGKTYVPVQNSYTYTVTKTAADNEFVAYYEEVKNPVEVRIRAYYWDTAASEQRASTEFTISVVDGQTVELMDTTKEIAENVPAGYVFDGTPQKKTVTYPDNFQLDSISGMMRADVKYFNVKPAKEDPDPETNPEAYTVRVDYVVMDGANEILLNGRSKTYADLAKGDYVFQSSTASTDSKDGNTYSCVAPLGYRFAPADQANNVTIPVEKGPAVVKFIVELDNPADCALPHIIHNETELRTLEQHMDHNFLIANDFALTRGWETLGLGSDTDVPFAGFFDGNENTISGLHTVKDTYSNIGLFAINNGTIENLNLTANQMEGSSEVGTIAGINDGNGVISNVHVTANYVGALSQGSNGGYAGGLVGKNNGTIKYCSAEVIGSGVERGVVAYNYAGGLVGGNWGTIEESYARAGINAGYVNDINAGNLSTYYAGGFVGGNVGTIRNCYADVPDYIAGVRRTGGFAGLNGTAGQITSCYVVPNDKVYGGQTETSISIGKNVGSTSNCYAVSTTSGIVNGFTRITKSNLQNGSAVSGFDSSIWNFVSGQYPDLLNNAR